MNVAKVVAAEEAEHTGTLLVRHLPFSTRIKEAEKNRRKKKEKMHFSDLFMMQ